ncbi:MAG: T9SS type A sorting domain-containing protein, partial [Bacteroidales bacterium]|nr:T9SS type A sorting domain-containing protein [Bacteroidales bacterium]
NYLNYSPTNIDADPLFTGIGENPYQIDYSSPCIDAGTLELPSFIHLPETDLAGNPRIYGASIDMGAYEWNPTVGSNQIIIPEKEKILMVAPNPFSTDTRIMVKTYTACHMQLAIYNNSGQRVKVLMDGTSLAGTSKIHWHGEDEYNRSLPSGIYHVMLVVDGNEVEEVGVVKR